MKRFTAGGSSTGLSVCVIDCGLKYNQLRCLLARGLDLTVVPWNHPVDISSFDGIFVSNGPGDPIMAKETVDTLTNILTSSSKPVFGICLGHQLIARAIGAKTYKMK